MFLIEASVSKSEAKTDSPQAFFCAKFLSEKLLLVKNLILTKLKFVST